MTATDIPHQVPRCQELQTFGEGRHARRWQCVLGAHFDTVHDFGPEAEVIGRVVREQTRPWVDGKLIDVASTLRNTEGQVADAQQAVIAVLAYYQDGASLDPDVVRYLNRVAPTRAARLVNATAARRLPGVLP